MFKELEAPKTDKELEKELKGKAEWEQIKRQFTSPEQTVFVEHWIGLVKQFRGDIQKSEYMQITELIKLELLANRCLEEQKSCQTTVEQLEEMKNREIEKPKDQRDLRLIDGIESNLIANRQGIVSSKKEYLNTIEKKDTLFKALKATREQRYKLKEDSKTSFFDWIRLMIESKDKRKQVGLEMEKMRLAIEQERDRLGGLHKYEDGEICRPILDSDTVTEEDSK